MKYIFHLSLFMNFVCVAQQFQCGTANHSLEAELHLKSQINSVTAAPPGAGIFYIPLKMHLFGNDDDTGYSSDQEVNTMICDLNNYYYGFNIQFYFSGQSFNHYANSLMNASLETDEQENAFHAENAVDDAINLFASESLLLNGTYVGGYAYVGVTGPWAQFYNRVWLTSHGLGAATHELGHFLGLPHTFNNSTAEALSDRELVTRNAMEAPPRLSANCDSAGDFICDTESDPFFLPDTQTDNCVYVGTAVDVNGDVFVPATNNIMGYFGCGPGIFSQGQGIKMHQIYNLMIQPDNGFSLDAPETPQPAPTNLNVSSLSDYEDGVMLSWSDNSDVETGYQIEMTNSLSEPFRPFKGVGPNVTSVGNLSLTNGVPYYFRIKPSNSKSNYSEISAQYIPDSVCGNKYGQSCIPEPDPALAAYRIEDVSIFRSELPILENLGTGCSSNGTGNYYSSITATVENGEQLNFTVKSKSGTDGVYSIHVELFADWNKDGDFEDELEKLFENGMDLFQVSGTFSIPETIPVDAYRFRVSLTAFDPAGFDIPCGYPAGEIEDYKLINGELSVDGYDQTDVRLYPNPAHGTFSISGIENTDTFVSIFDVTGKKVTELSKASGNIDISQLPSGFYLVKLNSGNVQRSVKLVKM